MITKAKLKEQIEKLPDSFTIDELVESLVFLEKVELGIWKNEIRELIECRYRIVHRLISDNEVDVLTIQMIFNL